MAKLEKNLLGELEIRLTNWKPNYCLLVKCEEKVKLSQDDVKAMKMNN